uniref:Chemotaxis protein n=1 Tax=Caldisericum exile TaxID=693075 RepID=A0A7C4XYC5_9BACT
MLKNLSLKVKLLTGFIAVSLLTLVVGVVGFIAIQNMNNNLSSLGKISLPSISNLKDVLAEQQKIKVAIRTSISPYISLNERMKQLEDIEKARETYKKQLSEYEKIPRNEEEDKIYREFIVDYDKLNNSNNKIIEKLKTISKITDGKVLNEQLEALAKEVMTGGNAELNDKLDESLTKLINYVEQYRGTTMVDKAVQTSQALIILMLSVAALSFIFAILLGIFLGNSISKGLNKNTEEITKGTLQLESAGTQVASASQELSSGASELASSVEEITSSMEELQSIIESNTKSVNEAEILMKETLDKGKISQAESEELLKLMNEVQETSKKILKINKAVDDIAFQTNILALNAAVEAARAGDAGRGFAVVAEQVKSLAQKSAELSKETSDLIDTVVESIGSSVTKTGETVKQFKEVVERSEKVNVLLDEVTKAFKEQSKGASQVTKAISQVNTVVQQTAASSEETASSSEELLGQVEALRDIVVSLNTIVLGEKEAQKIKAKAEQKSKSTKEAEKTTHKLAEDAHKLREEIAHKKSGNIGGKQEEVEIVKPEEKIPLDDFKEF